MPSRSHGRAILESSPCVWNICLSRTCRVDQRTTAWDQSPQMLHLPDVSLNVRLGADVAGSYKAERSLQGPAHVAHLSTAISNGGAS
jgi:hypothetical protein